MYEKVTGKLALNPPEPLKLMIFPPISIPLIHFSLVDQHTALDQLQEFLVAEEIEQQELERYKSKVKQREERIALEKLRKAPGLGDKLEPISFSANKLDQVANESKDELLYSQFDTLSLSPVDSKNAQASGFQLVAQLQPGYKKNNIDDTSAKKEKIESQKKPQPNFSLPSSNPQVLNPPASFQSNTLTTITALSYSSTQHKVDMPGASQLPPQIPKRPNLNAVANTKPLVNPKYAKFIEMGFNHDSVARACRVYQDEKQIVDFLVVFEELRQSGCNPEHIPIAMTTFSEINQQKEFCLSFTVLSEYGFPQDRIIKSLVKCKNNKDLALEDLLNH